MPKVRLLNGKPLMVNGKVALSNNCCCTTPSACSLPEGDCPKAVCFELFLDDTDASNQDFFDMFYVGAYFDGSWQVYGDTSATLAATDPFNTWHKFIFQLTKQLDGSVLVTWSVDGVAGPSFNALAAGATVGTLTSIQFGAQGGSGAKHRSIRNISILGFAISFDFPPDSFSNLVGTGITESGGILRIDNDTGADAYGNKLTYADLICCTCPDSPGWRDCTEISAIDFAYSFTAHSDVQDCSSFDITRSHTFHFDRIDVTDTFDPTPGVYQFKLYQQRISGICQLIVQGKDGTLSGGTGVRHDFDIESGVCSHIFDRLGLTPTNIDEGCTGGTLEIGGDETTAFASRCRCELSPGVFVDCAACSPGLPCPAGSESACGSVSCGYDGAFGVIATGIPWLPGDVSGIIGVYSSTNTCTVSDPGPPSIDTSMTVSITVTIS